MIRNSNLTLTGVFTDFFIDIVFFPFWWYSFGLIKMVKRLAVFVADKEKSLAFFVWMRNIFVPMYGQRDWQGAIISFFVRLVQIIFRAIFLVIWITVALAAFWLWVIAPAAIVYMIIIQFCIT
jgi:hypothetical protein